MKKILAALVALSMMVMPAVAAETEVVVQEEIYAQEGQTLAQWAVEYLADGYSLKLVDDGYTTYIEDTMSAGQVNDLLAVANGKLAALVEEPEWEMPQVTASSRGAVAQGLFDLYVHYGLGEGEDAGKTLEAMGVLLGDGTGLALERECTYQEGMVMVTRFILACYDQLDAGSLGLLWKATNGGNTLYLLGTQHMDRGNLYPFHKSLREAITSAEEVILELDLNDIQGMMEFVAMQTYGEGERLEEHVSDETYALAVEAFSIAGLDEETVNLYKPWALSNTLTSLMANESDSTETSAMAIDLYVNALAANQGIPVVGAETYALQGGIFDTLSEEYQDQYLAVCAQLFLASVYGQETENDPETQAALDLQEAMLSGMMDAWQTGDAEKFETIYGKSAIVDSDDELNARLFTDRDPGMIRVAAEYLAQDGAHTGFMAVGAGHMVDPGGIVSGLKELGFEVEYLR